MSKKEISQEELFDLFILCMFVPKRMACDPAKKECNAAIKSDVFQTIKNELFPRENEPESFNGYVSELGGYFLRNGISCNLYFKNQPVHNFRKVKITIEE